MAAPEAIFRGSPAEFESAVRAYDRQIAERHGHRRRMLIYRTAVPPAPPGAPEVAVVVSDQPLGAGNGWDMMPCGPILAWQWRSTITAHALPAGRSRLIFQCEEAMPEAEQHWQALLAALARLGFLESEPAPATRKKRQPEEIAERQEKVLADFVAGHTIEKIAERQVVSVSTVNRDFAELEKAGKIIRDKSASAIKNGTKDGTAMTQDR